MGTNTTNPSTPRASRRGLLALAPALAATAPARIDEHPDVALLAAVARFRALNALHAEACHASEDGSALAAFETAYAEERARLVDVLAETRATTVDGIVARGQALAEYYPERLVPGWAPDWDGAMVGALLRDLVALAGRGPATG